MASAAVGGSHIVASTQAGAIHGGNLLSLLSEQTFSNILSSVSACNIRLIQIKPYLKAIKKKVAST